MATNHWIVRTALSVFFSVGVTTALAQQPFTGLPPSPPIAGAPFGSSGFATQPSFDPYVMNQQPLAPPTAPSVAPGTIIPTTPGPVVIEQTLPIFPADRPVRFVLSGEFLYLRASDAAMTSFAVPVNSAVIPPPTPPVPLGTVAAVELGFRPGFRVGLDWVWNDYSRWVATYSQIRLRSSNTASVEPGGPTAFQSLVMHPSTAAADELYLDAFGSGELRMRLGDIEYRRVFVEDWYRWDFLVGARYAHLEQRFNSSFTNTTTIENVDSSVNFDGGGIRFGSRGDWRSADHGFYLYAQGTTGFVAGRFSSRYDQTDNILGLVASTSRKDDRIINITDLELGGGWHTAGRRFWISGGYMFNTWSRVVSNAGLIRAAQTTSFAPIRERLTFDGFVGRAEFRF